MVLELGKSTSPSFENRAILSNVDAEHIRIIMNDLVLLEINRGCGTRPCHICCWSAPKSNREVIPFSAIQELHRLRPRESYYRSLSYYYQSDSLYYLDTDYDFGDVAKDALGLGMPLRVITHGWIKGEETPEKAVIKINELAKEPGNKIDFTFSLDNYGWIGTSPEIHRESIAHALQMLPDLYETMRLSVYYNPNDAIGTGSIKLTQELVDAVVPEVLKNRVQFTRIQAVGRAKNINPIPPEISEISMINYLSCPGCLIRSNGDIIYMSSSKHFPERNLNVGNIFTGLNSRFYDRILPIRDIVSFSL